MNTPRPAGRRFRAEAFPLALAALLAVSLPAEARGGHGGGHSGGGHGGGRSAHATGSRGSSSSSRGSSMPRTAHPVPSTPGTGRQPSFDRSHDHDGGHFHGGHRVFFNGGFFFDPFFYDFYYPYGYWGWGGAWWAPDYDPYYAARPRSRYYERSEMGALDLDVSPGRTEVWVDGERLGIVDSFDGWPDYLWLPRGTYDVVFYLDGYKTISRQITVYPGNVIDIDDKMEPGPSTRPEDLATKTHERRDERWRDEAERHRQYGEDQGEDEGWHDRVRRDRGSRRDDYHGDRDRADDRGSARGDRTDRGRLVLDVQPEDASIYVDGRFVGTGTDLSMMRSGLPLAAGDHKLAIVRPGRRSQEKDFTVKAGEDVKLDVRLDTAGPG